MSKNQKGELIYRLLDDSPFYQATAEPGSRSLMNVTFRLPNEELEQQFIRKALEKGLGGQQGY